METIILKRFDSPIEANIVKGFLESNEIFCFLQDEHSIGINPLYANALGGIKLMVRVEDAQTAQDLLMENSTAQKPQCPQCTSHDVDLIAVKQNKLNWLAVLSSLFGMSTLSMQKKYECHSCKHIFELK